MEENNEPGAYGKMPLWQWVLIYVVIGLIVYGIIYYFVLANREGTADTNSPQPTSEQSTGSGYPY